MRALARRRPLHLAAARCGFESAASRLALGGSALTLLLACGPDPPLPAATARPSRSVVELLAGGDTAGFARAVEPRAFEFPADHGPHPAYRTEWWYFTGHLATESGRRFGYQLTFFRNALAARESPRSSNWATRQVYMAHLALTDLDAGVFHSFERFARGAVGLAGASRHAAVLSGHTKLAPRARPSFLTTRGLEAQLSGHHLYDPYCEKWGSLGRKLTGGHHAMGASCSSWSIGFPMISIIDSLTIR